MGNFVMQSKMLAPTVALTAVMLFLTIGAQPVVGQAVDVRLPAVVDDVGQTIQIPVLVDDISGKGITTFYLKIEYDANVLEFDRSVITNTLSDIAGAGKFDGTNTAGEFTVAYAAPATRPLSGEGTLILLEAEVLGAGTTPLSFLEMQFNDDNVPSLTYDGLFSTEALSFADLSVSLEASSNLIVTGESFTVTTSIINSGQDPASDVVTSIDLPADVAFESATDGCSYAGGVVTCQSASLSQSQSVAYMLTLTAPATAQVVEISTAASTASVDSDPTDNSATINVSVESDLDGVSDEVEADVPNLNGPGTGDGNGDGIADSEQGYIASLPNATDGSYVTVAAPEGTLLANVAFSGSSPGGVPGSVELPDGVLNFEVHADVAAAVTLTIYTTKVPNTYLKYGPTPDNPANHWYEFLYDGTTGAEIFSDRVELYLVDGHRGDADLTADGTIVDPGAVALSNNQAPAAENDAYEIGEDQTLDVTAAQGVLSNDVDPNEDELYVSVVSDVENGVLTLEADGRFTYSPDENFNGIDSFTYAVTDGLLSDEANVTITVDGSNDAPAASEIQSPSAGESVIVGGETSASPSDGEEELLAITWSESIDPEGDEVSYVLFVAEDANFENVLAQFDVTAQSELIVSVAQAAAWFDTIVGSSEVGAEATVYLRIATSDGSAETTGDASSLVLVRGSITSIDRSETPDRFALQGNYPNPFNPSTNVLFDVPQAANVSIDVFDSLGRRVYRVPAQPISAGTGRSITIDASSLPSGAYVYRVVAEMEQSTTISSGVMTLMK